MEDWTLEEAFLLEEKINSLTNEDLARLFENLGIKSDSENIRHDIIKLFSEVPKDSLISELKNFGIKIM